jgi:hypothetical protein
MTRALYFKAIVVPRRWEWSFPRRRGASPTLNGSFLASVSESFSPCERQPEQVRSAGGVIARHTDENTEQLFKAAQEALGQ